jgi:hypothetical protein
VLKRSETSCYRQKLPRRTPFGFAQTGSDSQRKDGNDELLVAQRYHGIDSRGAACGNVASSECNQDEQHRDSAEG